MLYNRAILNITVMEQPNLSGYQDYTQKIIKKITNFHSNRIIGDLPLQTYYKKLSELDIPMLIGNNSFGIFLHVSYLLYHLVKYDNLRHESRILEINYALMYLAIRNLYSLKIGLLDTERFKGFDAALTAIELASEIIFKDENAIRVQLSCLNLTTPQSQFTAPYSLNDTFVELSQLRVNNLLREKRLTSAIVYFRNDDFDSAADLANYLENNFPFSRIEGYESLYEVLAKELYLIVLKWLSILLQEYSTNTLPDIEEILTYFAKLCRKVNVSFLEIINQADITIWQEFYDTILSDRSLSYNDISEDILVAPISYGCLAHSILRENGKEYKVKTLKAGIYLTLPNKYRKAHLFSSEVFQSLVENLRQNFLLAMPELNYALLATMEIEEELSKTICMYIESIAILSDYDDGPPKAEM